MIPRQKPTGDLPAFMAITMPNFLCVDGFGSIQVAIDRLSDEQAEAVWDAQKAFFLEHVRKRRALQKAAQYNNAGVPRRRFR